eukprot:8156623-Alexandrium_andersonii.AAC.1
MGKTGAPLLSSLANVLQLASEGKLSEQAHGRANGKGNGDGQEEKRPAAVRPKRADDPVERTP